jgi:hypothetical protein
VGPTCNEVLIDSVCTQVIVFPGDRTSQVQCISQQNFEEKTLSSS